MTQDLLKTLPEKHEVNFGSKIISFALEYRPRKTLAISVYPDSTVRVIAPEGQSLTSIKGKVLKRAPWIVKQKFFFSQFQPKQPNKKFISGETHRYLGRQYRLKLLKGVQPRVTLKGAYITVYSPNRDHTKRLLGEWYRQQAEINFKRSLARCFKLFNKYGLQPPKIKIKQMSKRWGSCTTNGTIYLNPELIKASSRCIDYVMVHELCHLRIKNHSAAYYRFLKKMMPDWEERKQVLEKFNF
jgi:predicted metal-dependent hydrolase